MVSVYQNDQVESKFNNNTIHMRDNDMAIDFAILYNNILILMNLLWFEVAYLPVPNITNHSMKPHE